MNATTAHLYIAGGRGLRRSLERNKALGTCTPSSSKRSGIRPDACCRRWRLTEPPRNACQLGHSAEEPGISARLAVNGVGERKRVVRRGAPGPRARQDGTTSGLVRNGGATVTRVAKTVNGSPSRQKNLNSHRKPNHRFIYHPESVLFSLSFDPLFSIPNRLRPPSPIPLYYSSQSQNGNHRASHHPG